MQIFGQSTKKKYKKRVKSLSVFHRLRKTLQDLKKLSYGSSLYAGAVGELYHLSMLGSRYTRLAAALMGQRKLLLGPRKYSNLPNNRVGQFNPVGALQTHSL